MGEDLRVSKAPVASARACADTARADRLRPEIQAKSETLDSQLSD
jgi:hypothetical protein